MNMPLNHRSQFAHTAKPSVRIVSCQRDPLNLRPGIRAVWEEIEAALPYASPQQPLVALMTEQHTMPTDVLLQQGVLKRITVGQRKRHLPFAYGVEVSLPLVRYIRKLTRNLFSADVEAVLLRQDPMGTRALKAYLCQTQRFEYAPHANYNVAAFCTEHHIVPHFNDLALVWENVETAYLDPKDHYTESVIKMDPRADIHQKIYHLDPLGMALRNRGMALNIMRRARKDGISLYAQQVGRDHVGNEEENYPYEDSVCAYLEEMGAIVLPVNMLKDRGYTSPKLARFKYSVLIEDIDPARFKSHDAGEAAYVKEICNRSGLTYYKMPSLNDDNDAARHESRQWLREARKALQLQIPCVT